jgi:hypothetical protein
VILEGGESSNLFELLKGTAQGDCPSPIIYNICAQILIFRIELDEKIHKLPVFQANRVANNVNKIFKHESNFETSKNESFANDSTTLTYFEYSDLAALKHNLEAFSVLSGLKCNFEKTVVVRFGDINSPPDPRIAELGCTIENECTLLGFKIENKQDMYAKNFEKLAEKAKKTINFWKIFNLSLPGKIMVVKSLVYPILNYYLSILEPSAEWLKNIESVIENFVLQGINVGKEKLYLDPDEGSLGLFKPEVFFCALRCSWIKRCTVLTHDNWRHRILNIADPGPCYMQQDDILEFGPIISGILKSVITLRSAFGKVHNNFLMVPVLNNTNFFSGATARIIPILMNYFLVL